MPKIKGFPPILPPHPRVLVLGSMPSAVSLQKREYYGHPTNAFWPIMARLLGFSSDLPYAQRREFLRRAGISLWDVLSSCVRRGSSDAGIMPASERPNAVHTLIKQHRTLVAVFSNGGKANLLFHKHIAPKLDRATRQRLRIKKLPSTSAAYATMTQEAKTHIWHEAFHQLSDFSPP